MWHQDWPFWPTLSAPEQVTAWIALDDVDMDNGCMSMVPGSHKWGNQAKYLASLEGYDAMPDSFEGHEIEVVRCPVKKGQVHFHHPMTWHGSHANTSGRPRRAIALHYMYEHTSYVEDNHHCCNELVTLKDGEKMSGEYFPLVYSRQEKAVQV